MDFLVNLYAKFQGWTSLIMEELPLLGAVGGVLGVASSVLIRASAAHDPAGLLHAVHPTAEEMSTFGLCWATIKLHFNHKANAAAIVDAKSVPLPNQPS